MGRRKGKTEHLDCSIKVSLNKEMYDQIGKDSAEQGISMAEVLRRAYMERSFNEVCEKCIHYLPDKKGKRRCVLEQCKWSWE